MDGATFVRVPHRRHAHTSCLYQNCGKHLQSDKIMMSALYFLSAFFVAVIYSSFFEWLLHKWVMHRPFLGLRYPFRSHAGVHHRVFKADQTYHLLNPADKQTIPMAWWNGPVLIIAGCIPFAMCAWLVDAWCIVAGAGLAIAMYYGLYETIHWCMHLPKSRRVELLWIFRRLNGHHLLHHRYMHKNFNVVLPFADLCLGTLLLRSQIAFTQATGPAVPNVQPSP